jgi:hypothetical protein
LCFGIAERFYKNAMVFGLVLVGRIEFESGHNYVYALQFLVIVSDIEFFVSLEKFLARSERVIDLLAFRKRMEFIPYLFNVY